jgi:hypothetical protein
MKVSISAKCSDLCFVSVEDGKGNLLVDGYDGYVPAFMPDEHYGDYVILDIDVKTGKILNWRKEASKLVQQFVKEQTNENND